MNFIYIGRLIPEKGINKLLKIINYSTLNNLQHSFLIFGQGPEIKKLLKLKNIVDKRSLGTNLILSTNIKPSSVYIFGHQPHTIIHQFFKKTDYTIIPSQFLETFGLVALESIQHGVPIIASNKGGLKQFLLENHDIKNIYKILQQNRKPSTTEKQQLITKSQQYSSQEWIKNLKKILPSNIKKILLISDFKEKIGGTETHLYKIYQLLKDNNYQVQIYTENKTPNTKNFFKAIFNIKAKQKLTKVIRNFQPDCIWCHSILRSLGSQPLKVINKANTFKVVTIHDLGLFTSRPSKIKNLKEIGNFSILYLIKKILLINPIIKELKKFNIILTPSSFMNSTVAKKIKRPTTLSHF